MISHFTASVTLTLIQAEFVKKSMRLVLITNCIMILIIFVLLISAVNFSSTQDTRGFDRFIISCHTTDFECFRRQYLALRDHVLLGNHALGIHVYPPYVFQYSDTGTCVQISGVQDSELNSISFDSEAQLMSLVITMPIHIQQIPNTTHFCLKPARKFPLYGPQGEPLKKFSGNATIEAKFPYAQQVINATDVFLYLQDENLDVVLDIPDLSHYDKDSELEVKLYEWSEWAFDMVQHVDVAEHVVVPYIDQYKILFTKLPIRRFILLYPDEKYTELKFNLSQK